MSSMETELPKTSLEESAYNFDAVATFGQGSMKTSSPPCSDSVMPKEHYSSNN